MMPEVVLRHLPMVLAVDTVHLAVITEVEVVVTMEAEAMEEVAAAVDMVEMKAVEVMEQKEAETELVVDMEVTMVEVTVEGVDMVETMEVVMVEEVAAAVEEVVVDMEVEVCNFDLSFYNVFRLFSTAVSLIDMNLNRWWW
jgi:transcriptional regulator with PAS, ATPase and Fis domain